eukprot:GEMP01027982.1.p1 GENE.GEMP01027982.1~~GEMP01027982.1.p1  ORF type:complete len:159 (+),score=43.51 GEMP01027982.1:50-526(+)
MSTNIDDLKPKRFGLKFNPPTLILEYLVPSTGKLFHRRMSLKAARLKKMDPHRVAEKLKEKNPVYLADDKIRFDQVVDLITKLRNQLHPEEETRSVNKSNDLGSLDLNKLSTVEVEKHKKMMDVEFYRNQKLPGDADFIYDLRIDFPAPLADSGWDSG